MNSVFGCVSGKSPLCTGIGIDIFGQMCSNCADLRDRPREARRQSDIHERLQEEYEIKKEFMREFGPGGSK